VPSRGRLFRGQAVGGVRRFDGISILDCRTVIAFLVVTSIINLALGYALAIYLGVENSSSFGPSQANGSSSSAPSTERVPFEAGFTTWTPSAPPTTRETGAKPTESPSSLGPTPLSQPDEQPAGRPEWPEQPERPAAPSNSNPMDQELLAGIEEFRNQLAQLKTQGLNDLPNSFASESVGAR
jgi:hypothetical protein